MKHKNKSFKGFSSIVFCTENDVEIEFNADDIVYITSQVYGNKDGKNCYVTTNRFMVILRAESNGKIAGYEDCDDTKFDRINWISDIECIIFKFKNKKDRFLYPYNIEMDVGDGINQIQDSMILPNGDLVVLFTGYDEPNHLTNDEIMAIVKGELSAEKISFRGFSSIVFYTENDIEIEFTAEDIIDITQWVNATKIGRRKYETSEMFGVVIRAEGDGAIEGYEPDTKFQRLLDVSDIDTIIFKYKNKANKILCPPFISTDDKINQAEVVKRMDNGSLVVIFTEWKYVNSLDDDDIDFTIYKARIRDTISIR